MPGESALMWPERREGDYTVLFCVLCFDEGTDDNDAAMWEYCTKLKLLVRVNVFVYLFHLFWIVCICICLFVSVGGIPLCQVCLMQCYTIVQAGKSTKMQLFITVA